MKKAFLKKLVVGVITATTMTTLTPLGVSAATNNTLDTNSYIFNLNKVLKTGWLNENGAWYYFDKMGNAKTGWIKDNGKWYFCDNTGEMQTGVIKVNGKTYCLNNSGAMETGKVNVNNTTYKCSNNGQVVGDKAPTVDKVFDNSNVVVKDNNQNSTVTNLNDNQTTKNIENTVTNSNDNQTTNNIDNTGNTNNSTDTTTSNTNTGTATDITNVDVQGLPKLPQTYPISVQASAESQILQLMNAKRTEAGLQPLTLDNTLVQVARYKSNDMIQNNFFDHTNPDGTKWTNWLQAIGYKYTTTGENIAYNTYDAVELFNQWWNSPGHRANMMNASYNKVGIGVIKGNNKYMGTQEFSN
jgi:Uncharacterized protein with SCP/PR1 domains